MKPVRIIPEKFHNANVKINLKLWKLVRIRAIEKDIKPTNKIFEAALRLWLDNME